MFSIVKQNASYSKKVDQLLENPFFKVHDDGGCFIQNGSFCGS